MNIRSLDGGQLSYKMEDLKSSSELVDHALKTMNPLKRSLADRMRSSNDIRISESKQES